VRLKAYLAYLRITLLLTSRDRVVLFFNYLMPLLFFIAFSEGLGAGTNPGAMSQVVSMVIIFGVLGTGFFGGGIRATMDREAGILRRFKVAPITPAPILAASLVTGWALFLPSVFLFILLAKWRYGWQVPSNVFSLLVVVTAGVLAFRAMGLIIASVVNSMQESQIIAQLLYMPLLLLSGATIPLHILPAWLQKLAQFLPATHLYLGTQGILVRGETAWDNRAAIGAMLLAAAAGFLISLKLFRWEKEEKIRPAAKLWLAAVLLPFIAIGAWQLRSEDSQRKMRILERQSRRSQSWLIRDARIFPGSGPVMERGAVLVRNGRIERVFNGPAPSPKELHAETLEAGGRTLLPALIDSGAVLPADNAGEDRVLASYVYCGVGAIVVTPDARGAVLALKRRVDDGELLGPEIFFAMSPPAISLAAAQAASGDTSILAGDLAQQFYAPGWLQGLATNAARRPAQPELFQAARERLRALWQSGELPAPAGAAAGPLGLPGPALVHELTLWTQAGVPAPRALEAATAGAAVRLGAQGRLGCVREGCEATLLLVDGNPLEDIGALNRIHSVFLKGERVSRAELASQNKSDEK